MGYNDPVQLRTRAIGIFDSGVGGLTVLKEVARLLPSEDILYLGDTARVPYGTRSERTILKYSLKNAAFLLRLGIKLLVVACNTSSAVSLPALQRENRVPVVGVIEPGARRAAELTRRGRIGVIGTEGTVRSGAYQRAIASYARGEVEVIARPCPLFVPLVEEGWTEDPITYQVAHRYLDPLRREGIDVLVLGCTHYPLLEGVIREVMGPEVALINSARETAWEVKETLAELHLLRPEEGGGRRRFFVTDNPEKFIKVGRLFLGEEVREVEEVDL